MEDITGIATGAIIIDITTAGTITGTAPGLSASVAALGIIAIGKA